MTPELCELDQPIWAIAWHAGTWPRSNGVTYAAAIAARKTAEHNHPGTEFTIITFEAAQRHAQQDEQNGTTV